MSEKLEAVEQDKAEDEKITDDVERMIQQHLNVSLQKSEIIINIKICSRISGPPF